MTASIRSALALTGLAALALTTARPAAAQTVVYDNTETAPVNYYVLFNGPVTYGSNTQANMDADHLALAPGSAGRSITTFVFEAYNPDVASTTARASVFFWADDGPGGNPGTYLTGLVLPVTTFTGMSVTPLTSVITGLTVPADGSLWAGIVYDDNNGTTGATPTQIGDLGGTVYDPPTVGSSGPGADFAYNQYYAGVNNPAIIPFDFGGQPPVNYGWRLTAAVPEPSTVASLGVGSLERVRHFRACLVPVSVLGRKTRTE